MEYQDINPINEFLFKCDGVHLSQAGNEIFLHAICAAVENFKITGIIVYQKLYVLWYMWHGLGCRN